MLVVTAEIWPEGDEYRKVQVAQMLIANESDLAAVSDYSVVVSQSPAPHIGVKGW